MALLGTRHAVGSAEEFLAEIAIKKRNSAQFLQTMAIINAIIQTGNAIVSAVTASPASSSAKGDGLKKCIEALRDILVPDDTESREREVSKVFDKLKREVDKGPIHIKRMDDKGRKKKKNPLRTR